MSFKAILVGLATALMALACGGSDPEVDLEQASQAVEEARVQVEQARETVEARESEMEQAQERLAEARSALVKCAFTQTVSVTMLSVAIVSDLMIPFSRNSKNSPMSLTG